MNKPAQYAPSVRLTSSNVEATLKCNLDTRDYFSSTLAKGNGLLSYPVATITADEIILAGGNVNEKNEKFYLNATLNYWTMTPSQYQASAAYSTVLHMDASGKIYLWDYVSHKIGIRPVINLSSDVLISSGDGTTENPFQLKLS